jgi:hypothetical protein
MNDDTTEFDVEIVRETELAYLLKDKNEEERRPAWFPKSQVVFIRRNDKKGIYLVDIPDWLLDKNDW